MTEAEWLATSDVQRLLRHVLPSATRRKALLYLCGGCYRIAHLFYDSTSSLLAVDTTERHVDGLATDKELRRASYESEAPSFGYDFDADFWKRFPDRWTKHPEHCNRIMRSMVSLGAVSASALEGGEWRVDAGVRARLLAAARLACFLTWGVPNHIDVLCRDIAIVDWPSRWMIDCVWGNPFRPVAVDPSWLTPTVTELTLAIYDSRTFDRLPMLADALEQAGCSNTEILSHCRSNGAHVRGCWVVDSLLCKA